MKLFLVILIFTVSAFCDFQKCTEGTELSSQMRAFDSDIAYNENLNEYLIVFISQVDKQYPQTSVLAQRYDEHGSPVGDSISIVMFADYPNLKRFPRVVYNGEISNYFITFEYDINGDLSVFDLCAISMSETGTIIKSPHQLLLQLNTTSNKEHLEMILDKKNKVYVLMFEITFSNLTGVDLALLFIDYNTDVIIGYSISGSNDDAKPFICLDDDKNQYLLLWTYSTDISKVVVGAMASWDPTNNRSVVVQNPRIIASLRFNDGTPLRSKWPRCAYAKGKSLYLLTFEAEYEDSGVTYSGIVGLQLNSSNLISPPSFLLLGTENPQDKFPQLQTSETFFVIYQTGDESTPSFQIMGTPVTFKDNQITDSQQRYFVSTNSTSEYAPQIVWNNKNDDFFCSWTHGNPNFTIGANVTSASSFTKRKVISDHSEILPQFSFTEFTISTKFLTPSTSKKRKESEEVKPVIQTIGTSLFCGPKLYQKVGSGTSSKVIIGTSVASVIVALVLVAFIVYWVVGRKKIREWKLNQYKFQMDEISP